MFTFYLYLAPFVACTLMTTNYLISTSNSYIEKDGPFECGFTSYQQSRSAFSVAFILVAILFLPFDLEISSILPYVVSAYSNGIYGLSILITFLSTLVIAFVYEINLGALNLERRYINKVKECRPKAGIASTRGQLKIKWLN
uniref:NADH-ubiquinone oxidoreductase chain 3 n=1 Tax=Metschnikowia bowlesiae TaxID=1699426 RepID=A0A7H1CNQ0_9ASCO|nr:Nad3 [Metschnikowia bowlesiae]QNS23096.1 Nad3 [Metschnikowia bowlesiae]